MSLNKTRSVLYKIARFLGDLSALTSGDSKKVAKRVGRRSVGRVTGRTIRKIFK